MKILIVLFMFLGLGSVAKAEDKSPILTCFIKARKDLPLVLSESIRNKVQLKEQKQHVQNVGDVADHIQIPRVIAEVFGYVPLEGQKIEDLKNYPELISWMQSKKMTELPDNRLNLINGS